MKILIVGSDLNSLLLAKYIKLQSKEHDIYLTTEDNSEPEVFTGIDIKENNIEALVDFVKYNAIEFTISMSQLSIINGIVNEFKKEGFMIFAPFAESARLTFFNSIAKKVMYKLKINTPRFGIFDRENIALDYIRKVRFPIILENDFTLLERKRIRYNCFSKARLGIQQAFEDNNDKLIIENYIDEPEIYAYFITDGYNALPLIGLEKTKDERFETVTAQSKKFSNELKHKLLKLVIYPLLDDITKYTDNYVGIIGIRVKLIKETFAVLEIYNNFQDYDFQAFLSLLNENLFDLIFDTANGCLADNYSYIKQNENYSYSVVLNTNDVTLDKNRDEDFSESKDGNKYIITSTAITTNRAKEKLFNYLETILEKDLFDDIIKQDKEKEQIV